MTVRRTRRTRLSTILRGGLIFRCVGRPIHTKIITWPSAATTACGPAAARLTEEQVKQIRELQTRFVESVKTDLETVKAVAQEAREAKAAGKSREEIAAILARGNEAHRRIADAERKLQEAILALLTPEQRHAWLCRRG